MILIYLQRTIKRAWELGKEREIGIVNIAWLPLTRSSLVKATAPPAGKK